MISIVICTYNRADILVGALDSIYTQQSSLVDFEVLVIDNNSTDNTQNVVQSYINIYPNFRYYIEKQVGLSYARNRGWQEAKGEYIAYLDDDSRAAPEWLKVAQEIITNLNPGVFGGPYYAFYNSPKPYWWKDEYRSREHAEQARPLILSESLSGNNIVILRSFLKELGGFDPQFGMTGNKVATCEEDDFLLRLRIKKPEVLIYYDPKLSIEHLVHPNKMSFKWLIPHRLGAGKSIGRMKFNSTPVSIRKLLFQIAKLPLKVLVHLIKSICKRDKTKYPYVQNYWFKYLLPVVREAGFIWIQLRLLINKDS